MAIFFKRPSTFVAVMGWVFSIIGFVFFEPILAPHLQLEFGFDSAEVAFFYSIFTVTCLLSNLCLAFKPPSSHLNYWNSLSTLGLVACLLLLGPSSLLNLPSQSLTLVAIGIAGIGVFSPIMSLSSTLLIIQPLIKAYPRVTTRVASLFGIIREIM